MNEFVKIVLMFCIYLFSQLRYTQPDKYYVVYEILQILSVVFYGIWCYHMGLNEGRYGK